jgi:uncharacterized protein YndB with AHSA1/START domain
MMKNLGTLKVATPSEREIELLRIFDSPRELVFDALTNPELLVRWFGPRDWSLAECKVNFKVGGNFRFMLVGPNGSKMGMSGEYREIAAPRRMVHMSSFDDYPGEAQVTSVLDERGEKTTLMATILYPSRTARDIVLQSGLEHGAAESYDKLAELLTSAETFLIRKGIRKL